MDKLTKLGQTFGEYFDLHEPKMVEEVYDDLMMGQTGAVIATVEFADLLVEGGKLSINGAPVCSLDDEAYGKICSLLGIPTAYLLKLSTYMRDMNVMYWFKLLDDKEVRVTYKDDALVSIKSGVEIDVEDVFGVLADEIPDMYLMETLQQTNSVQFDFVDKSRDIKFGDNLYLPGVRYVHKEGLKAPEVSPIFVETDSCAVIEFGEAVEPLNIKNMEMKDILKLIGNQVSACVSFTSEMEGKLNHVLEESKPVGNPRRRIYLLCKENSIPSRIRQRVTLAYDDIGWYGDFSIANLAVLVSNSCYLDTVKPTSARRLQKVAGHIITQAAKEHRCHVCDSLTDET